MVKPEEQKPKTAGESLGDLIKKLEVLEKVAPYLCVDWVGSGVEVSYKSKEAQALVEEIDLAWICKQLIKPYITYDDQYHFLNDLGLIGTTPSEPGLYDGIRWALTGSGTSDSIHTVILFLKKVLRNVQRKQEQPEAKPPAEPETSGQTTTAPEPVGTPGIEPVPKPPTVTGTEGGGTGGRKAKGQRGKRRGKTAAQLAKEARERKARELLRNRSDWTAEELAGELGCDKSTVCRMKIWKTHKEKLKNQAPELPLPAFNRDDETERTDVDGIDTGPKPEHLDIKQMIDEYDRDKSALLPTTQAIMQRLSLDDEKEAERFYRETLHHFPELTLDSSE